MRVVAHFSLHLGFGLRDRLPFILGELRESQEIMSVRCCGIDLDRTSKLVDGRRHILGIAIRSTEEYVQRTAVTGDVLHLTEDLNRALFVLRLLRRQQTE